jgi:Ca2+-binding EF-hand superfamily protein
MLWYTSLLQALVDARATDKLVTNLRQRINGSLSDMIKVFKSFDDGGTGALAPKEFQAALASLGVVLSSKEQELVIRVAETRDGSRQMLYLEFCHLFPDDGTTTC